MAAHLLSNHYNATRTKYYPQLDKSSRTGGDITEFIHYALEGFVDGLKEEIGQIQAQQIKVHWINHIHNMFKGKKFKTDERQKELMLELTRISAFHFSFEEIRHATSRIAEVYAGLNDITLKRDLADLLKAKLLIFADGEYALNIRVLEEYLTVTAVRDG